MDIIEFNLVEHNKNKWYVDSCVIKHVARGWKLGKINKKKKLFSKRSKNGQIFDKIRRK
jgi:hypothetical protein